MPDHNKLRVWQQSQDVVVRIADALSPMISKRMPGLRNQLLRSAASIAATIAEGASQPTAAQYARYLGIAMGSASETESHLMLAIRLDVVRGDGEALVREVRSIRKMLYRLREAVVRGQTARPASPATGAAPRDPSPRDPSPRDPSPTAGSHKPIA